MAKAKIYVICSECGEEFTHVKTCRNRREADSYEEWAAKNITLCPRCWQKEQDEIAEERLAKILTDHKIALPEIIGKSEKQIRYAALLRTRELTRHISETEKYLEMMSTIQYDQLEQEADRQGKTEGALLEELLGHYGMDDLHVAMIETDARVLINRLKML